MYESISKESFLKLNEDDIMFITNPGRMGDEGGSTFVVRKDGNFVKYRVDGWLYRNKEIRDEDYISLNDALKQFPKWHDAWEKGDNSKYKYLYMGFGNGLSIDNSIYNKYEPYLNKCVEEYLKDKQEESDGIRYAAIYNVWEKAFDEMIEK